MQIQFGSLCYCIWSYMGCRWLSIQYTVTFCMHHVPIGAYVIQCMQFCCNSRKGSYDKKYVTVCDAEREGLIYTVIHNWSQCCDLVDFQEKRASETCLLYMKSNKVWLQKQQNFDTHSPDSMFIETKLLKIAISFLCEVRWRFGSVMGSCVHRNNPKNAWIIF